jgi:hypothetical protein
MSTSSLTEIPSMTPSATFLRLPPFLPSFFSSSSTLSNLATILASTLPTPLSSRCQTKRPLSLGNTPLHPRTHVPILALPSSGPGIRFNTFLPFWFTTLSISHIFFFFTLITSFAKTASSNLPLQTDSESLSWIRADRPPAHQLTKSIDDWIR